jgi:hypothetical protein
MRSIGLHGLVALSLVLTGTSAFFGQQGCRRDVVKGQTSQRSPVLGCWELVRSSDQATEPSEADFREDGRLLYSVLSGDRWQIMKLTYRVEGDVLITNQPSSPREERTRFFFESDGTLVLELGGQRSWFRRAKKRAPEG